MQQRVKPIVLIILDGWGYSEQTTYNPTRTTPLPTFDRLFAEFPWTLLEASGEAVGLPVGQMGNSEVGHLHIGSGRLVAQDLTRISAALTSGSFADNPILQRSLQQISEQQQTVHLIGLVSDGGVHSHVDHFIGLLQILARSKIKRCYVHAILDGRDTPPQSALKSLQQIETVLQQTQVGRIASIVGRYYAMDRDNRWERTQAAYDLYTAGRAVAQASSASIGLEAAYARGETDEFVKPTLIQRGEEESGIIRSGDAVFFMNFRPDRARQLSRAFTGADFSNFQRTACPQLGQFVTLTAYADDIPATVLFPSKSLKNTLGEYLAYHGLTQLRLAETEKYAHVTYFLNGGIEEPFPGEDRQLIPSPKVATYDLQPEMSAKTVTDYLQAAILEKKYDLIVCNYANPDMVGHTGQNEAACAALITIDQCLQQILQALQKVGGIALITADHGNIEQMFDEQTGQPHTAHTCNPVPCICVGYNGKFTQKKGSLQDIAPTLLKLLGLPIPQEMQGENLLRAN